MKKYAIVSLIALLPICTFADDKEVSLKLTSVKFDYSETNLGKLFNTEKSNFGDIKGFEITAGSGALSGDKGGAYQNLSLIYNKGDTDYIGSLQGGNYGDLKNKTSNRVYDISWIYGARFMAAQNFSFGTELGLGYRNWLRQLSGTGGYEEEYRWVYLTAGVNAKLVASNNVSFAASFNLMRAYNPKMYAGIANGVDFDLGDTDGNKYGFGMDYKLNNNWSLVGEYVYENWNISKSNTVAVGGGATAYEPDSKTRNQIAKIGFKKSW